MRTALLLTAALVSCNPAMDATTDPNNPDTMNPDNKPPIKIVPSGFENKNGTRLKYGYSVTRGGDGLAVATQAIVYDSALKTRCYAANTADGKQRCIPFTSATLLSSWYSDSACTDIVMYRIACQIDDIGKFGYLYETVGGKCQAGAYRVVELGTEIQATTLFIKEGAACRPIRSDEVASFAAGTRLFKVGRRMDPSELAEVSVEMVIP